MSEKKSVRSGALLIICVILMIASFVLQCVPFWNFGEVEASINGLIWRPRVHEELQTIFSQETGGTFDLNALVLYPVLQTVSALVGAVICLFLLNRPISALLPICCGVFGMLAYLTNPVLQMGNLWGLHLAVSILLLICGCAALVLGIQEKRYGIG